LRRILDGSAKYAAGGYGSAPRKEGFFGKNAEKDL
jgi:hypothetical protein